MRDLKRSFRVIIFVASGGVFFMNVGVMLINYDVEGLY